MSAHVGDTAPSHRDGHCLYSPTRTAEHACYAPATVHIWVSDPASESTVDATFACPEHAEYLIGLLDPADWHDVTAECRTGSLWHFADVPGEGFCYRPDEDPAAILAALAHEMGVTP